MSGAKVDTSVDDPSAGACRMFDRTGHFFGGSWAACAGNDCGLVTHNGGGERCGRWPIGSAPKRVKAGPHQAIDHAFIRPFVNISL
jgi:hypothetical protein